MNEHTTPQATCPACPRPTGNGERVNPCPSCGEHVSPHILATSPGCPHGWGPVTSPADLADVYVEAWSGRGESAGPEEGA